MQTSFNSYALKPASKADALAEARRNRFYTPPGQTGLPADVRKPGSSGIN